MTADYGNSVKKMDTESQEGAMSRRECLCGLAGAGALAIFASAFNSFTQAGEGDSLVKVADLSAIPNGSVQKFEQANVILVRSEQGIACMSTYCTHLRNKLNVDAGGHIVCPAHGSHFDSSGKPVSGPAPRPLAWYSTQVKEDGSIWVDITKKVEQGQWAVLPKWAQSPASDASQRK